MVATPGIDTVASGAVVVFVMQLLKKWKRFPWLKDQGTKWVNRVVAAVLAGVAAIGIGWTYNAGVAGGTLTFTCISWPCLAGGVWAWIKSFAVQETIYQATADKNEDAAAAPPK